MEVDPTQPIFKTGSAEAKWMTRSPLLGGVLLAATVGLAIFAVVPTARDHTQLLLYATAAAWAIGAPLWFLYEYHCVYRESPGGGSWELFKHGQQVAIPVWAGVATSLYALGSSDLAKVKEPEYTCVVDVSATRSQLLPATAGVTLRCTPKAAK